jgi:hypothetical protein
MKEDCFDCEKPIYPTDEYLTVYSIWQEETYRFHLHCALDSLTYRIEEVFEKQDKNHKMNDEINFEKEFWKPWNIKLKAKIIMVGMCGNCLHEVDKHHQFGCIMATCACGFTEKDFGAVAGDPIARF